MGLRPFLSNRNQRISTTQHLRLGGPKATKCVKQNISPFTFRWVKGILGNEKDCEWHFYDNPSLFKLNEQTVQKSNDFFLHSARCVLSAADVPNSSYGRLLVGVQSEHQMSEGMRAKLPTQLLL